MKIRIFLGISTVILHGNSHDKQIFLRTLALIALNDFFIKFLVGHILAQNFRLVKIIDKMCLIKSHIRINGVAAPPGLIIRMHRHAGITDIFKIRYDRCRCVCDILLVHNGTAWQKCHRVSGHKLPLGIWRFCPKYRGKRISLDGIFL